MLDATRNAGSPGDWFRPGPKEAHTARLRCTPGQRSIVAGRCRQRFARLVGWICGGKARSATLGTLLSSFVMKPWSVPTLHRLSIFEPARLRGFHQQTQRAAQHGELRVAVVRSADNLMVGIVGEEGTRWAGEQRRLAQRRERHGGDTT